jgi:hypothetical protein
MWRDLFFSLGGAIVASWLALIVALVVIRPKGNLLRESLRILPDLIRLFKNLTTDVTLPRGVRTRLGLLMAYLGYADDAIVAVAVLRSVVHRVGLEPLRGHWPGSPDGFVALCRLAGLRPQPGLDLA